MFLTIEELQELTGWKLPSKQAEWLTRNGWLFALSAGGRPKVLRTYTEHRLGGTKSADPGPCAQTEPNFAFLTTIRKRA